MYIRILCNRAAFDLRFLCKLLRDLVVMRITNIYHTTKPLQPCRTFVYRCRYVIGWCEGAYGLCVITVTSNFSSDNITLTAVLEWLLHILTQYFARRLKSVSQNQKCLEISVLIKYKMAAGRRFENALIAIIRPHFEISLRNLVLWYMWAVRYFRWRHISVMAISKMAAAAILNNHSNGCTSVAVARIYTILRSETNSRVPELEIAWN